MKKLHVINKTRMIFLVVVLLQLSSCENDFINDPAPDGSEPPIITSVSEATEDEVVTQGVLESTYIIRGKNLASLVSIHFNGFQAGFNPVFVTDNVAFVKVPEDAPYIGQSNIMRLETLGGVVEYDFSLLTIEDFTEETINGVKQVHLFGGDFTDTDPENGVTFVSGSEEDGNLVELNAEILSISETQVTAIVPSGVEQAFIYLSTTRGAVARSSSYGFSYSIYIDSLNPDWSTSEWGGTHDLASTEQALGEFSIKSSREGWSGLTFLPSFNLPYNEYNSITVSLYGTGASGDTVILAMNDFDGAATHQTLELVPGEWTKYVIPLSAFYPNGGEPDTIFRMDFQESSNTGLANYIFYIDDFGFL